MSKTLSFLFILLLVGCNSPDAAESISATDSVFVDSKRGYQFSHPENWKARTYRSGIVVSEANDPTGRAGVQFRITNQNGSIESYSSSYITQIEHDLNAQLSNKKHLSVNDYDCLELEFTAKRGNSNYYLYQLIYFIPIINRIVIIQAGCETKNKDSISPIIHRISKSLVILDKDRL
jgi:hypothetical protein